MNTEEQNITRMQELVAEIKSICKEEIARAEKADDAKNVNAWCKAFHKTGKFHTKMTDLLLKYYPQFGKIVTRGPGGR